MRRFARIDENRVSEVFIFGETVGEGEADLTSGLIPCGNAQIGDVYDFTHGTFTPPAVVVDLDAAKTKRKALIESWRDEARYANVQVAGHTWQADENSQMLLTKAIVAASVGLPLPPVWRDADNVDVPVSNLSDLVVIAAAFAMSTQAAYAKSWQLKERVDSAVTLAEILAVEW